MRSETSMSRARGKNAELSLLSHALIHGNGYDLNPAAALGRTWDTGKMLRCPAPQQPQPQFYQTFKSAATTTHPHHAASGFTTHLFDLRSTRLSATSITQQLQPIAGNIHNRDRLGAARARYKRVHHTDDAAAKNHDMLGRLHRDV